MFNIGVIKNLILPAALLLGSFFTISAYNAVKFTDGDSKETIFMLKDRPKVTHDTSAIIIETDKDHISFDFIEGSRFDFIDYEDSGIESLTDEISIFKINNGQIEGQNLKPNTRVFITDISGKIISSAVTDQSGKFIITTEGFNSGVYIFNSNAKNFKFIKR